MKRQFKLSLFNTSIEVANSLIIGAASHNGGMGEIDVYGLKTMGEGLVKTFYPHLEITFEIVGETTLCVDAKVNGAWHEIAEIKEIEVFELSKESELNGLFTSTKEEKEEVI